MRITRIKLDRMGYDKAGRYWGVGDLLWHCDSDELSEGSIMGYGHDKANARAPNREAARMVFERRIARERGEIY